METIWQDVRYGFKMLLKSPVFTLVAVLSLGLGIGVNTAIFSLVNAVLFRPLPLVSEPDRLVWLRASSSYPNYEEYRDQNDVFSGMLASGGKSEFSLSADGQPELIQGEFVTANYFSVLGVEAALGRTFLPEEDRTPGAHPVVVISHRLWQNRFGSDPELIGKAVTLNGLSFIVVGVAPKNFIGMEVGMNRDVWVPMMMFSRLNPRPIDTSDEPALDRINNRKPDS